MPEKAVPPSEHPFQVWVEGGAIHSGHQTRGHAEAVAREANAKATAHGLKTQYVVKEGS